MSESSLPDQVRETRRVLARAESVKREWVRASGGDRIHGGWTAVFAGMRWVFRVSLAAGPALLPLLAWSGAAGFREGTAIFLGGLVLLLSCARVFSSMEGCLSAFEALRMPSRRAFLLAGWKRRAPWVLATSFSWTTTVLLGMRPPWTGGQGLLLAFVFLAPPLAVAAGTWNRIREKDSPPARFAGALWRAALGLALLVVGGLYLLEVIGDGVRLRAWQPVFLLLFGAVMFVGNGWDLVKREPPPPGSAIGFGRTALAVATGPGWILFIGLPALAAVGAVLVPPATGTEFDWFIRAILGRIPWYLAVLLVASWLTLAFGFVRFALEDFDRQECSIRKEGDDGEDREAPSAARPVHLAPMRAPPPRGLDEAIRFRNRSVDGRFSAVRFFFLVGGLSLLTLAHYHPEAGWMALVGVLIIWRDRSVDVSSRLHLLGADFREQYLQNLRRLFWEVAIPVVFVSAGIAVFQGMDFDRISINAIAVAAVLFRAGLRGAWRWTRERWQTAAFFASLLALLTVTLIGGRLFGFDSARTNFLLAYLYGSFGIAGLAWHLATLDEARLREENRA